MVFECHLDKAVAKKAFAANRFCLRDCEHRDRERVGNLIFDVLGRSARPRRENDDLVLTNVRNGVDRYAAHRHPTQADRCRRDDEHDQRLANAKAYQSLKHLHGLRRGLADFCIAARWIVRWHPCFL